MIEAIKYIILIFLLDQVLLTILKKTSPKLRKLVFLSIIVAIYAVFYELAINRLPENYFEVFTTDRIVSPDTLKKSFRKLSLKYHPDRAAQENVDPNLFQTIRFQYETLQDENSRALYDKFGPEAVHQLKLDQKNQVQESTFDKYQRRTLKQDGIYYMVFAVAFIAMCSDERLNKCRKLCLVLVLAFYGLEASFLWGEQQIPDAIDSIFSSYAIWERIEILKGLIGLVCITIKLSLQMGLKKPDADIKLKLKHIKELQEKVNHKARTIEVGTLVKHCNGDSEFKKQLAEIEKLTKEAAKICEENNTEQKKDVKNKRKRRIKLSVMTVLTFTWAYYFAPF